MWPSTYWTSGPSGRAEERLERGGLARRLVDADRTGSEAGRRGSDGGRALKGDRPGSVPAPGTARLVGPRPPRHRGGHSGRSGAVGGRCSDRFSIAVARPLAGCGPAKALLVDVLYDEAALPADLVRRDLAYLPDGQPKHRLNLFLPLADSVRARPWPVVLFVHGGGWTEGDRDFTFGGEDLYGNVGRYLAGHGIGTAVDELPPAARRSTGGPRSRTCRGARVRPGHRRDAGRRPGLGRADGPLGRAPNSPRASLSTRRRGRRPGRRRCAGWSA